jgi:hypothetical protein
LLQKIDKNGNMVWKRALSGTSNDTYIGNVTQGRGDTIFATISRSSFSSSTYYSKSSVVALNSNGQTLWTRYFSNVGLTSDYGFSRTMLAANGDFIGVADIRGSANASANGMMITRITPQGTIVFSKYFDFRPTHTQLSVTGLTETASGNLVFGGRLMTDQISTYPNSMWLAKLDAAGNTLQQKVYSGGTDVGELLHSLRFANGKLYASVHQYAPFDSVKRSFWIGELNEASLSFTAQNAIKLGVTTEDPYGNVRNALCITADGKPTMAGGFYCEAIGKNLPVMLQWSASLTSSCPSLDASLPLTDSVTTYTVTDYVSVGTFTVSNTADTTSIIITTVVPVTPAPLCNGCAVPNSIASPEIKDLFRVYPNPGDGRFHIDLNQPLQDAQVMVYNNQGTLVYKGALAGTHHTLDLGSQAAGIYYLKVSSRDGNYSFRKLVKVN